MRGPALVAVVAALAIAPTVGAQGTGAQVAVRVVDLPSEPLVVESDDSESATYSVNVEAENFACTGEGTFPVEQSLDASPGATDEFTLEPTRLNFTVPAGTYSSSNTYNETMESTFTVTVEGEVTENHTHEPTINADFLPGEVENCSTAGGFPEASDSGSLTVEMVAPQDSGDGGGPGGGTDGGDGGTPPGEEDGDGIPGPGAAAGLAALAAAARAVRRD